MNWRRITWFTALMFVATFLAAAPFGIIEVVLAAQRKPVPTLLPIWQGAASQFAAFLVFVLMALRQRTRPREHAAILWLVCGLLSFPLNVIGFGQTLDSRLFTCLVLGLIMLSAVCVGAAFQRRPATPD